MFKHTLGHEAKDRITGLIGILTSRSENVNMCNRYYIQPKVAQDSKVPDGYWVDEDDVVVIGDGILTKSKSTGGPMSKIR